MNSKPVVKKVTKTDQVVKPIKEETKEIKPKMEEQKIPSTSSVKNGWFAQEFMG